MRCGQVEGLKSLGLSAVALGLLRSIFPSPDQVHPASDVANSENVTECPVATVFPQWEWSCQLELNIFMDTLPEDFFALTVILQKANHMMRDRNCAPHQYPIKQIVTGGGARGAEQDLELLMTYLANLEDAGQIPTTYGIRNRAHAGPTSSQTHVERYDGPARSRHTMFEFCKYHDCEDDNEPQNEHLMDEWAHSDAGPVSTLLTGLPRTMDALIEQSNPTIVALRPLWEFVPMWIELRLADDPHAYDLAEIYEEKRRLLGGAAVPGADGSGIWNQPTSIIDKIRAAFQAIGRSRLITYHGRTTFSRLGFLLVEEILFWNDGNYEWRAAIRDLEETFVNLPEAFVLVDRELMIGNVGNVELDQRLKGLPTFPKEVYQALQRWAGRSTLETLIVEANEVVAEDVEFRLISLLEEFPVPANDAAIRLLGQAHHEATRVAFFYSTGQNSAFMMRQFRIRVTQLLRLTRSTYHDPGSHEASEAAIRAITEWAASTVLVLSNVLVSSLIIPFVLTPEPNMVLESLERVRYGGREGDAGANIEHDDRPYAWPPAPFSPSSVWLTRASGDISLHASQARQQRLQRELGRMYGSALDPGRW